jgi:L-amino acid N-acyltransferase YncA
VDEVFIREMTASDWPAVREIFAAGISTGDARFESEPPPWDWFDAAHRPDLRLVAVDGEDTVIGWIAAGPVSGTSIAAWSSTASTSIPRGAAEVSGAVC